MKRNLGSRRLGCLALGLVAFAPAFVVGQEKATVPAGGTVNVIVSAGTAPPPVSITLAERHGHVTPSQAHCSHSGGGLIDVAAPAPDTVIITMTGAVVGNAEMRFELDQCFEVNFDDPKVKQAKLSAEGRVVGLMRGGKKGCGEYSDACAHIATCGVDLVDVCVPPHSACDCDALAVNDHDGPKVVPVMPGKYTLHQTFVIVSRTGSYLCKRASAEFAPDPALDPLWISYWEPFHGVKKDSFGFQMSLKLAADSDEGRDRKAVDSVPRMKKLPETE